MSIKSEFDVGERLLVASDTDEGQRLMMFIASPYTGIATDSSDVSFGHMVRGLTGYPDADYSEL